MSDIENFFEAEYIWKIPGTNSSWPGKVCIKPGNEITLTIREYVLPSEVNSCLLGMPKKIKIIHGIGGNEITLLDGIRIAFSKSISGTTEQAKVESTYSFLYALKGELLSADKEPRFKSVIITFTNMSNWTEEKISKKLITDAFVDNKGTSDVIPIFANNKFSLSILKSFKVNSSTQQMSLRCYSELLIESLNIDRFLDLYEYLKIVSNFAFFLSLSEGKNVYPQSIKAVLTDKAFDIYYLMNGFSGESKPVYSFEMLFTYEDIKNNISQILANWFELANEEILFYDAWSTYFYYSNIKTLNPPMLFILLIEALEAYHKKEKGKRWSGEIILKDEIKDDINLELEKISNILRSYKDQIEQETYSTLMQRINIFKDPTLKSAIKDMLEGYKELTGTDITIKDIPQLENREQFVDVIVILRNLLTHRDKRILDDLKLFEYNNLKTIDKINNKLEHIMKVLLFADLGFSRKVTQKEVLRYQHFMQDTTYLSDELTKNN